MKKVLLSLSVLFTVLIAAVSASAVEPGSSPPDFQLTDIDGTPFKLSDLKGELIILKLATTWCPTCLQQSNEFIQAAAYLKEKNIRVVEVYLQDSGKMVRAYQDKTQYGFPHYTMVDDGQALKAYNVYLIPRVILINRDFKVMRDGNILTAGQIKAEFDKLPVSPKP
ncbi:TlpA family protein disulfide reductase [Trichloromonas sp.]|uniref:TlpA family protein disulfide reductase n=1 Tax=Trichloromonas sp. TaxID=3069249 RepID=UPI002A433D83|nr:TlpA disulfide reductase family protein [Trichloromonas sp.]